MKNKKTSGVEGQLLGFSEESVYITKAGVSKEFILKGKNQIIVLLKKTFRIIILYTILM